MSLRQRPGGDVRVIQVQPKQLAVLTYLALAHPREFVRRDALLALLWPEQDERHARNALSQATHGLRRELGADVVLTRGHQEVGLSPRQFWCDAVAFRQALSRQDLRAAVSLYQGELTPAFHVSGAPEFERWLDTERRRLRGDAFRAALRLADREESAGRPLRASRWLRRAVDISPTDEPALRRLISALNGLGNGAAALLVYEEAAAGLRGAFDLEPSPETAALARAIRARLAGLASANAGPIERPAGDIPAAPNAGAHEAFLRGRYLSGMLTKTAKAIASYQRAIALDPDYAPAHAGMAMCYANLAVFAHVPPAEAEGQLEEAACRAIALDDGLSDAHVALGIGRLVFSREWAGAGRALRRAVELNPSSAYARAYLAVYLSTLGWTDAGVAEAASAAALDPLDPWPNFVHGFALYRARLYEASLQRLRLLLELYPHHALAHLFVAENELKCGRAEAAAKACRTALTLLPRDQLLMGIGACVLGLAGRRREARRLLAGLEALSAERYVNPAFLAAACVGLGRHNHAFAYWDRMVQVRAPSAFLLKTDPLFDDVRPDPRFRDLLRRLGLADVTA